MNNKKTISEIAECVISEMKRLLYSPSAISCFRKKARDLSCYVMETTGEDFFSEDLGRAYLKTRIGFPFEEKRWLTSRESAYVRCVRRVGEYQLYGAIWRTRGGNRDTCDWALGDIQLVSAYVEAVQTADNSEATKKLRIHHIQTFYEFLACHKIGGVQGMTSQIISLYANFLQGNSPVYTKHLLATLRYYFRFLYRSGFTEQDWSHSVPKVIAPKNANIPELWKKGDVERMLESIDRGSPSGKRDYAIILMVAQLGLRISDIASLRLENLKWERKEMEVTQHKTGNLVILPLLENVGWAIIDYLQHGRPQVDEPYVFLTVNAPYTQLQAGSIGCILDRQRQRCGIQKHSGTVGGMHSLRHALARKLLESGTPLSEVADIMGHTSFSSTSPYLKVDIDGLRVCALSLGKVLDDA